MASFTDVVVAYKDMFIYKNRVWTDHFLMCKCFVQLFGSL